MIIFVSTAGHGYLKVPLKDLSYAYGLGMKPLSGYSFLSLTDAYLEEDEDAGKFIDATKIDINKIKTIYQEDINRDSKYGSELASSDEKLFHFRKFAKYIKEGPVYPHVDNSSQKLATVSVGMEAGKFGFVIIGRFKGGDLIGQSERRIGLSRIRPFMVLKIISVLGQETKQNVRKNVWSDVDYAVDQGLNNPDWEWIGTAVAIKPKKEAISGIKEMLKDIELPQSIAEEVYDEILENVLMLYPEWERKYKSVREG